MEFEEYLKRVARRKSSHKTERMGQAYFNQLHEDAPTLADEVRSSEVDPFYNDDLIGEFLAYVSVMWEIT